MILSKQMRTADGRMAAQRLSDTSPSATDGVCTCQLQVCGPRLKQLFVVASALASPQANKLNTSLLNLSIKVDLSRETSLNPIPPSPFSSFHTCDASVASLHPLCHPRILFIRPTACHRQRTQLPCSLALASQPWSRELVPDTHTHTHLQ